LGIDRAAREEVAMTTREFVIARFHAACNSLGIRPSLPLQDCRNKQKRSADEIGRIVTARRHVATWLRNPTDGKPPVDQRAIRRYLGKSFVPLAAARPASDSSPPYNVIRLNEALAAVGTTFEVAFARNVDGNFLRGDRAELRRAVWLAMRAPDPHTGVVLSLPEIAAACRMGSHTSIVESVCGSRSS
jgi:hypothetical protein